MDFHAADRPTLERMLADPRFGEPIKDRIRARLATMPVEGGEKYSGNYSAISAAGESGGMAETPRRPPAHKLGRMNHTETRYVRDFLDPRIASGLSVRYQHEKVKLRLANGTWYTRLL